jgi:hypothetical protein
VKKTFFWEKVHFSQYILGNEILKLSNFDNRLSCLNNLGSLEVVKKYQDYKKTLLFSSTYIKIWLIPLVDNCHCGYITKKINLKKYHLLCTSVGQLLSFDWIINVII